MFGRKKKLKVKTPKVKEMKHSELHKKLNKKCNLYVKRIDRTVKLTSGIAVTAYVVNYLRTEVPAEQWGKAVDKVKGLAGKL